MIKPEALAARLLDVVLVVSGAAIASHIRFDDIGQRNIYYAFVAFAAAFALALFPAFGVYESRRGRSEMGLVRQVSLAWLTVQTCALVLMFTLHRSDFVSRLWFAYWTGTTGALLIVSRVAVRRVLDRLRHAGMNLRQVAVVGRGAHAANWCARLMVTRQRAFAPRRYSTYCTTGPPLAARFLRSPPSTNCVHSPTTSGPTMFMNYGSHCRSPKSK
jgi:FlaA1/EpsC-like NDP-sugar epimerase